MTVPSAARFGMRSTLDTRGQPPMTQIPGYTDLELIGQGGFAVVYKAKQVSIGRDVAIKLLSDPSPDDDLVRRFERESRAVGALSWHPHIAAVVDAGATPIGQAYIVFELLSGGSLDDRIVDQPMPWTEAVASIIQVADAVEAAHRADVLHRDIKPANILLDRLGVAKLGDFGIASMQDGTKTETGMLATTVAHAAPELFDGHAATAATDVYALGSTLHNLVTGAPPFEQVGGERMAATLKRIANEPPPRPDPALVPEPIAAVMAHALAKQPNYRLRSAAAFGKALQSAQRKLGVPVTAMPVSDRESPPVRNAKSPPAERQNTSLPGAANSPPPQSPATDAVMASPSTPPQQVLSRAQPVAAVPAASTTGIVQRKPYGRTIGVLGAIAVLLVATIGGGLAYQARRVNSAVAVTTGGARIQAFDAFDATEMPEPLDEKNALDRDEATYWGITPNAVSGAEIVGTTFLIELKEPQTVISVGISNGTSTEFARVSELHWASSQQELNDRADTVFVQQVDDAPGLHVEPHRVTTDQLVVAIFGLHDPEAAVAAIAELLIEVE